MQYINCLYCEELDKKYTIDTRIKCPVCKEGYLYPNVNNELRCPDCNKTFKIYANE